MFTNAENTFFIVASIIGIIMIILFVATIILFVVAAALEWRSFMRMKKAAKKVFSERKNVPPRNISGNSQHFFDGVEAYVREQ